MTELGTQDLGFANAISDPEHVANLSGPQLMHPCNGVSTRTALGFAVPQPSYVLLIPG